jgi:hypothetical protein
MSTARGCINRGAAACALWLSVQQAACSPAFPEPDGSVTDWAEGERLAVSSNGSGVVVPRLGPIPFPTADRFIIEWSIGHFSPPDIYILTSDSSLLAVLDAGTDLCDVEDARALEYVDYTTGEQLEADRLIVFFNAQLDAHLALSIDAVVATGATAEDRMEGEAIAFVDASWFLQLDGSGNFAALCD